MSRFKTEAERLFYIQLTATERYTTRELERQINSGIVVAEYEIKLIPKETLRRKLNEFYELLSDRVK